MKKGFTLTELIGVVIILALIALLAFPPILNAIRSTKGKISDASKEILYNAVGLYVSDNSNTLVRVEGNTYCVTINDLIKGEYLPTKVYDSVTGEEIPTDNIIEIKVENNQYKYNMNNECVSVIAPTPEPEEEYVDNSGANKPVLLNNMIPVYYDGTNWIYADTKKEWYDYDAKEWANAVVLNSGVTKNVGDTIAETDIALWYVWIPRYKYQLFNANNGSVNEQEIQIKFETSTLTTGNVKCADAVSGSGTSSEVCENAVNGNWYTHPAFTFGDQELTGFWVGKFEVSGAINNITIKPNVASLRSQTISSFFYAILNMNNLYEINGNSHMIKNMEWGAVAYLSHSKYGTCTDGECTEVSINSNSSYYTGGGTSNAYKTNVAQSTTGNIYGVYDMSGGAYEYVMGNMVDTSGNFYSSDTGFSIKPILKYYDIYSYDTNQLTHGRGKLGDATKETLKIFENSSGGWYNDQPYLPYSNVPWFMRGGYYANGTVAGIFFFGRVNGQVSSSYSTRTILVAN